MTGQFRRDERGATPVVEKTLAAGIALLYVGGMMGVLLGGLVPGYESSAGEELGERTLATAAASVETTPTSVDGTVEKTKTVSLPASIDDEGYRLVLADGTLTLDHPNDAFDRSMQLGLPADVTVAESTWESGGDLVIRYGGPTGNRTLSIGDSR